MSESTCTVQVAQDFTCICFVIALLTVWLFFLIQSLWIIFCKVGQYNCSVLVLIWQWDWLPFSSFPPETLICGQWNARWGCWLPEVNYIPDDVLVCCIKLLVFFFNCKCKKRTFSWVIPRACFCYWTLTLWLPAIVFCRLERKSQLLLVWWGKQSPSSLLMRYHVEMQDAKIWFQTSW